MKLIFTSDLHGSWWHYEQVLELLKRWEAEVLILGGDMQPSGDRGMPYQSVCDFLRGRLREFLERAHEIDKGLTVLTVLGNHDWTFAVEQISVLEQASLIKLLGPEEVFEWGGWQFLGMPYCPPAPYWIKDYERRDLTDDGPG